MGFIASHFRQAFIEGTVGADPLNTAFPPANFAAGTVLFVLDQLNHYLCVINALGSNEWKQLSIAGSVGVSSDVEPIWFAGALATSGVATSTVLANTTFGVIPPPDVAYRKLTSGTVDVGIRRIRVYVISDTGVATDVVATVLQNGAPTAITATIPPGSVGTLITGASGGVLIASGDRIALQLSNTGGGVGDAILVSAAVEFTVV